MTAPAEAPGAHALRLIAAGERDAAYVAAATGHPVEAVRALIEMERTRPA